MERLERGGGDVMGGGGGRNDGRQWIKNSVIFIYISFLIIYVLIQYFIEIYLFIFMY